VKQTVPYTVLLTLFNTHCRINWTIDFDISVVRVSDSALLCLSASQNYL